MFKLLTVCVCLCGFSGVSYALDYKPVAKKVDFTPHKCPCAFGCKCYEGKKCECTLGCTCDSCPGKKAAAPSSCPNGKCSPAPVVTPVVFPAPSCSGGKCYVPSGPRWGNGPRWGKHIKWGK